MKRLVWLVVLSAVVGCGGETKPQPTPKSTPEPKPTVTPPKGKQAALPE